MIKFQGSRSEVVEARNKMWNLPPGLVSIDGITITFAARISKHFPLKVPKKVKALKINLAISVSANVALIMESWVYRSLAMQGQLCSN